MMISEGVDTPPSSLTTASAMRFLSYCGRDAKASENGRGDRTTTSGQKLSPIRLSTLDWAISLERSVRWRDSRNFRAFSRESDMTAYHRLSGWRTSILESNTLLKLTTLSPTLKR